MFLIPACKPGFFGDLCDSPCPNGTYGKFCGGVCWNCSVEDCDPVNGCFKAIETTYQGTVCIRRMYVCVWMGHIL